MTEGFVERGNLLLWGWLLLTSGGFALAFFAYRLIWRERFPRPTTDGEEPLVRVRGTVVGRPGTVMYCVGESGQELAARQFYLQGKDGTWLVAPRGAVLAIRGYRHNGGRVCGLIAGEKVTVDGTATTLTNGDGLYREAGRVQGLEAVRISGGTWPELRWLRVPMVAAVVIALFSLAQVLLTPGPTPLRTRLARTFQDIPDSGPVVSGAGFSFSFQRVRPTEHCDEQGLGVLIGDQLISEIQIVEDQLTSP